MKRELVVGLALLVGLAQPTQAQTNTATSLAVDPARLRAAQRVIDQVMPPEQRDRMIGQMVEPMIANISQGLTESPQLNALFQSNPRAAKLLSEFVERQQREAMSDMRRSLPQMADAMARAYARRFTVVQLSDLSTFFSSPTGVAYLEEAPRIMADPDVAAWMRQQMTKTMEKVPTRTAELVQQLAALKKKGGQ